MKLAGDIVDGAESKDLHSTWVQMSPHSDLWSLISDFSEVLDNFHSSKHKDDADLLLPRQHNHTPAHHLYLMCCAERWTFSLLFITLSLDVHRGDRRSVKSRAGRQRSKEICATQMCCAALDLLNQPTNWNHKHAALIKAHSSSSVCSPPDGALLASVGEAQWRQDDLWFKLLWFARCTGFCPSKS